MKYTVYWKNPSGEYMRDEVECDVIERNDDSITFMKKYSPVPQGLVAPSPNGFVEAMYMTNEVIKIQLKSLS